MNETTCPQCSSDLISRSGVSKAGKPYSGIFCTNRGCDYKEWGKTTGGEGSSQYSGPSTPASNPVVDALRELYKQNKEQHEELMDKMSDAIVFLQQINENRGILPE